MAKEEMLNQNDPEKIMIRELTKKRAKVLVEFDLSRSAFMTWYVANVSPVVEWTNPVTAWMFAAWVQGSGVDQWRTEKEQAILDARRALAATRKAEKEAKEAAAELEKEKAAAERAAAEVKRAALKEARKEKKL